jgi:hypothetical protein
MNPLLANIGFLFKNYIRQHRYLRDLAAVVIFSIFFGGFLSGSQIEESIWLVFAVFVLILNLLTAPSVFFLEKGNTLYFLLGQPGGRRRLFIAKIIVIVLIDLSWVLLLAVAYGMRFFQVEYFLLLPLRLVILTLILTLSTLLLSLSYTYHPQLSWLIFVLLIFGCIINKEKMFPIETPEEVLKVLVFLVPPFFELIFFSITLAFTAWHLAFLGVALIQMFIIYRISLQRMLKRDLF